MDLNNLKKDILGISPKSLALVIAVYLYGSAARGDNDDNSDYDILVCFDQCSDEKLEELKKDFSEHFLPSKCEFAFYSLDILKQMQNKGSYFLWHIKNEGVLLYQSSSTFADLLKDLPFYKGTIDDLLEYKDILFDVEQSLVLDDVTVVYDLSVLATLARNICISCCYMMGKMDFGRKSPILKMSDYFGEEFPFTLEEYLSLYKFRLHVVRDVSIDKLVGLTDFAKQWVKRIKKLLELAFQMEGTKIC